MARESAKSVAGSGTVTYTTESTKPKHGFYPRIVKRLADVILAILALVFLSPFIALTAILVRVKLGSPVLFKQVRPGKDGECFTMYKFRTMTDKRDENGELLPDAERLTKFGKLMRSLSVDELPELINIIKGDMSIIGPRPLLVEYLPLYSERQSRRHDVRPGLTGYAQATGRNAISWEQKFEYDVFYVENISLALDIKIFFKTVYCVFRRDGISAENCATMEPFRGNTSSEETVSVLTHI